MFTRECVDDSMAEARCDGQARLISEGHSASDFPAAIIWDLDGTLIDSAADLAQALNTLLREHGYAGLDEDHIRTMIGDGVQKLIERGFRAAGIAMREIQLQDVIARFMLIYSACATNKTRLFPGARPVLRYFSEAGVRQGICTNKPESITKQIISSFSIADHFDIVVGGDTTAAKKPDPLPLRSCLAALKARPRESLMIGDSAVDIATARALNMPVAVVSYGYARRPARTLGADFVIDKLSSSPAFLGELQQAG